jgi:hypothetical protein
MRAEAAEKIAAQLGSHSATAFAWFVSVVERDFRVGVEVAP